MSVTEFGDDGAAERRSEPVVLVLALQGEQEVCLQDLRLSHRPPTVRSRSFRQRRLPGSFTQNMAETPARGHRTQKSSKPETVLLTRLPCYQVEYTSARRTVSPWREQLKPPITALSVSRRAPVFLGSDSPGWPSGESRLCDRGLLVLLFERPHTLFERELRVGG